MHSRLPLWKTTKGRIFNLEAIAYCVTLCALAFVPFAIVLEYLE